MKKTLLFGLSLVTLTLFTNCSPYSQTDATDASSLADLACTANCITPTPDNLSIKANLNGGTQYAVAAALADFNIAGDCNEGGFASNTITWELLLNSQVVRNSTQTNANTKCVNGRFSLYILLSAISGDNADRTGLNAGGARAAYTLRMTIYGQTVAGGGLTPGTNGQYVVSLLPQ